MENKYSIVVETFRMMYKEKKLEIAKIKGLLNSNIITLEEYNYILGKNEV